MRMLEKTNEHLKNNRRKSQICVKKKRTNEFEWNNRRKMRMKEIQ